MVKLTIDGRTCEVPEGTRLFDACTEARGEPLPHFCYHPDLSVAGVCRLCQVEIEGLPKLTIACNTLVKDGMVVLTRSERVRRAVQQILELHLINHPVDCPICDQAGECGLQDQYMDYGLYESRFEVADKVLKAKAEVIGPHVILDKERCVLCSRCVRFCEEITGTGELGIFNRGNRAEIGVAPGRELDNNYSLNTVDICPVGALTSRDFRFQRRVWMLQSTPSVCPGCATGCNVRLDHGAGRIYRLKPRRNAAVNGRWMCDQGRMTYKAVHDEKRLTSCCMRRDGKSEPLSWQEAWQRLQELVQPGRVGLALGSPHQTLEELTLWRELGRRLGGGDCLLVGGLAGVDRKEGDDFLLDADRAPNRRALQWLGLPELDPADLAGLTFPEGGAILVYGADPLGSAPELQETLAGRGPLVYLGTHWNVTSRAADLVIPLSMWAEKDGLFVNRQGRVQACQRAVGRPEMAREDWRLLADLLAGVGFTDPLPELAAVRRFVAGQLGLADTVDLNRLPADGALCHPTAPAPAGGES